MSLQPVFAPADSNRPRITVHPPREEVAAAEPTRLRKSFQKATLGDNNAANWGGNGFGVDDFIDLVNPLQHIPVVGHIYRELTGDTASAEAKIIGGGLFGGPVGLIASGIGAIIEQENGQSIVQSAMALVSGESQPTTQAAKVVPPIKEQQLSALAPLPLPTTMPFATPATLADLTQETEEDEPALQEEAAMPQPMLDDEQQQKHETILELFGDQLASLTEQVQQDEYAAFAEQVKSTLG